MENRPRIQLKVCRVNCGKTREEWAKELGVSPATIKNWENYKTPIPADKLMKIIDLSGFAADDIILCP